MLIQGIAVSQFRIHEQKGDAVALLKKLQLQRAGWRTDPVAGGKLISVLFQGVTNDVS